MRQQPLPVFLTLDDLVVDPENPRLPSPMDDERAAIMGILTNQKEKLLNLTLEIIERDGLSPFELLMVYPIGENKYIAAEGNRRVAALKILRDPSIIEGGEPKLIKRFRELSELTRGALPEKILCSVEQSEAERDRWLLLRHNGENGGRGTANWGAQEKARFASRHTEDRINRNEFALKIVELVKKHGGLTADELRTLPIVPITTIERMIGDPVVRDALGIERSNEGVIVKIKDYKAVIRALKAMVMEIANKKTKVGAIMTKKQREGVVARWPDHRKPGIKGEPAPKRVITLNGLVRPKASQEETPLPISALPRKQFRPSSPDDRKVLIPPHTVLRIPQRAIKRIFIELKGIELQRFEHAAAVLLRVFLELSVEAFLDRHNISYNERESLRGKMLKVGDVWQQRGVHKDQITPWRNAASSHSLFSIPALHSYVHSSQSIPKKRDLLRTWDEMEPFFKRLWP